MVRGRKNRTDTTPYLMLAPTAIIMLAMMGYPMLNNIWLAFQRYNLVQPALRGFYGLGNFRAVFQDRELLLISRNTIVFVVCTVGLQFLLGFGLAQALKKPFRGRDLYQSVVFLPWAFSGMLVGLTFKWIFNGEFGPVNDILMRAGFITERISFLGTSHLALMVVILAMVWMGIPFFAIMILAALQSIPAEMYEACDIDGASVWMRFWHVTIPFVKPTLIMTLLLRSIWVFNNADMIYVITQGGPGNTTQTLSSYLYIKSMATLDFGFTAALGILFMLLLVGYAVFFIRTTKYEQAGDFS